MEKNGVQTHFILLSLLERLCITLGADAERRERKVNRCYTDQNQCGSNPAILPRGKIDSADVLLHP